jgi:hypothetical protein
MEDKRTKGLIPSSPLLQRSFISARQGWSAVRDARKQLAIINTMKDSVNKSAKSGESKPPIIKNPSGHIFFFITLFFSFQIEAFHRQSQNHRNQNRPFNLLQVPKIFPL